MLDRFIYAWLQDHYGRISYDNLRFMSEAGTDVMSAGTVRSIRWRSPAGMTVWILSNTGGRATSVSKSNSSASLLC